METTLHTPFNPAQVELLKVLAQGLNDDQMKELRQLLIDFQFRLLDREVELAAAEKGLTLEDINNASFEHRRTPYKSKNEYFQNKGDNEK